MKKKDLAQPTKLVEILQLPEVKETLLTFEEQTFSVKECPVETFDAFVSQYDDDIQNVDRQKWSIFQRWRMINHLLEQKVLEVHDGHLCDIPDDTEEASSKVEVKAEERPSESADKPALEAAVS